MAIFKCKMCGGDLDVREGNTVCECEYCGTKQTVPTADNDKKVNAFNRANHLRSICDFDKAAGVYESIVTDFPRRRKHTGDFVCANSALSMLTIPLPARKYLPATVLHMTVFSMTAILSRLWSGRIALRILCIEQKRRR